MGAMAASRSLCVPPHTPVNVHVAPHPPIRRRSARRCAAAAVRTECTLPRAARAAHAARLRLAVPRASHRRCALVDAPCVDAAGAAGAWRAHFPGERACSAGRECAGGRVPLWFWDGRA
eukprot:733372-Prymnesium_polylepis.1